MKKREVAIIVVVLVLMLISCKLLFGVNEAQQPKPLRDFLVQPPNSVYQTYGYSEETLLLYNLIDLKVTNDQQDARIKALELQVAELVKQVENKAKDGYLWPSHGAPKEGMILDWVYPDPNEVSK